jgi:hypothetical protein
LPKHVRANEVLWVYGKSRFIIRELRYIHPNARLPNDLGQMWENREMINDSSFADSPFYYEAIRYLSEIESIRRFVL